MVFETIYSLYEKEVVNEIKKSKTDEEIKFIERKGIIRDIVLKRLAKALSVAVYRNGKIEDVHAGECEGEDYFRGIPDSCMKAINIDVFHKIYTMLKLLLSTDEDDFKIANAVLRFSEMCASDWNEPELDDSIYNKELLDLL